MIDLFGIIISAIYMLGMIITCYVIGKNTEDYDKQESCAVIIVSAFWIIFWIICLIKFLGRMLYERKNYERKS